MKETMIGSLNKLECGDKFCYLGYLIGMVEGAE